MQLHAIFNDLVASKYFFTIYLNLIPSQAKPPLKIQRFKDFLLELKRAPALVPYKANYNLKHQFMAHTEAYILVPYRPMILKYSEILAYYCFFNSSL